MSVSVSTHQESRAVILARLAAQVGRATTVTEVARLLDRGVAPALGAASATVMLRAGDGLVRVAASTAPGEDGEQETLTVPPRLVADALDSGRPAFGAAWPAARTAGAWGGRPWSLACPLAASPAEPPAGAILFAFPADAPYLSDDDMAVLRVVADECAGALAHSPDGATRAQAARIRFLADASQVLASTLDIRETLSRAARLAVPEVADWCAIEILERDRLRTVATAHVDAERVETVRGWQARRHSATSPLGGSVKALRTGETLFVHDIVAFMRSSGTARAEDVELVRSLELSDGIWVPLSAHGRRLGVLTLAMAESGRRFTAGDIAFAEDLGHRVALAISNAELYSETRRVAATLQASLLPSTLPQIPGWSLTARYEQFGRSDVGGDFYDVAALSGRRLFAVVGDVMGHGADAAVAGARMRSAVRVLMTQDSRPGLVAAAMDRLMTVDAPTLLASAVFVLYDPATGGIDLTSAGHPPALLVRADGSTRFLTEAASPVLGIQPLPRPCKRIGFAVGDALLLYTDGLVERRGEDFEVGLARLRSAVERHVVPAVTGSDGGSSMEERLRSVVEATAARGADDVAALLLHRTGWE